MAVTVGSTPLAPYDRFTLYNSPYAAHDAGRAIDLYPGSGPGRTTAAPSPVSGVVRAVETVRAPPKPYAAEHDHLVLVDCDGPGDLAGRVARLLHVEPSVRAGDRIAVGDDLGELVRAGFFAPWVDNHLHLGVRDPGEDLRRAAGSLPLELEVPVRPLAWDGTGAVVETGDTYATLDAPAHPNPGEEFVGVEVDWGEARDGDAIESGPAVLDGGLPHYDGGGLLAEPTVSGAGPSAGDTVALNGSCLGVLEGDDRTVAWDDVVVTVDGDPVTGLSLFCARDGNFGAKLICPDREFAVGERVRVGIGPR